MTGNGLAMKRERPKIYPFPPCAIATICELQFQVRQQFKQFVQKVKIVELAYNNLDRSKCDRQQWQRCQRQLANLRQQVQHLDSILNSKEIGNLQRQWQELER